MNNEFIILFRTTLFRGISALLILLAAFLAFSCDQDVPDEQKNQDKRFYDVAGFINEQVLQLGESKPNVSKTTVMGEESNRISTNDIDWKKELELFSQADLNKPAFRQSYSISRPDSSTYLYTSKEGDRLPVRQLKIVVDSVNLPVSIEAVMKSENKLYISEKKISMQSERSGNSYRINSYRVEGFQKLVMMDKKPFMVEAEIKY